MAAKNQNNAAEPVTQPAGDAGVLEPTVEYQPVEGKQHDSLAQAYAESGEMEPGYAYRYVTFGGATNVVVEKLV